MTDKPDEFHGQGGTFIRDKDGKRRRVGEPAKDHPHGNRPRDEHGNPLDVAPEEKPAAATNVKQLRGKPPLSDE